MNYSDENEVVFDPIVLYNRPCFLDVYNWIKPVCELSFFIIKSFHNEDLQIYIDIVIQLAPTMVCGAVFETIVLYNHPCFHAN